MNLIEMLNKEYIFIADSFENTDSFYASFSNFLKEKGLIKSQAEVKRLFVKRENVHPTAIGKGAAAPHIYSSEFSSFVFTAALIKNGLDFKSDQGRVFLVFLIMSDEREVKLHLKALSHIARLVGNTPVVEELKKADNTDDIYRILLANESKVEESMDDDSN